MRFINLTLASANSDQFIYFIKLFVREKFRIANLYKFSNFWFLKRNFI